MRSLHFSASCSLSQCNNLYGFAQNLHACVVAESRVSFDAVDPGSFDVLSDERCKLGTKAGPPGFRRPFEESRVDFDAVPELPGSFEVPRDGRGNWGTVAGPPGFRRPFEESRIELDVVWSTVLTLLSLLENRQSLCIRDCYVGTKFCTV